MLKHLNITITGKVQGVFFRAHTLEEAKKYHISGFVRNEPNGKVYIEAEGESEPLSHFLEWCGIGPEKSSVESIQIEEGPICDLSGFEIRK
jgi:acylphosphatase